MVDNFIKGEFPNPLKADEEGVLGYTFDITADQVDTAYRKGIFPMGHKFLDVYWYSPDPRWVLLPEAVVIHKTMRKVVRETSWHVTMDTDFNGVIIGCAEGVTRKQSDTWIDQRIYDAYYDLYAAGKAHSVEVWDNDQLIGGLYGVAIGDVFCGESMFTLQPNASKLALIYMCKFLVYIGITLVDCQMHTNHLESLGAFPISRKKYIDFISKNGVPEKDRIGLWTNVFDNWLIDFKANANPKKS